MGPVIELARSGRAKCRGCGAVIARGERRLGDAIANPFAEGVETTHWYHLPCAALKRPAVLLEALEAAGTPAATDAELVALARRGAELHRLPRIDGAERAPSARASCRACRERIARGTWRVRLVFFDRDRFEPSGFVHVRCAPGYFGTSELLERVRHFARDLGGPELAEIVRELAADPPAGEHAPRP